MFFKKRKQVEADAPPRPGQPEPQPGSDGSGPVSDEFDSLMEEAKANPAKMGDLWDRTMQLEQWHMIPAGNRSAEQGLGEGSVPSPLVVVEQGRPMVCVYTSRKRAHRASVNRFPDRGEHAVISAERDAAITAFCNYPQEVVGVMFNLDTDRVGYFAPISNLPAMYEHQFDRLPLEWFDRFVDGVRAQNHPAGWARLERRLGQMNPYYMLCSEQEGRPVPAVVPVDGGSAFALFTDEKRLEKALQQLVGAQGNTDIRFIEIKRQDLKNELRRAQASDSSPSSCLINYGSSVMIMDVDQLEKALAD